MTVGLAICNSYRWSIHTFILHGYGNMEPQISWGHDLDLMGSRDVVGHVTIPNLLNIEFTEWLNELGVYEPLFCTFCA